MDKKLKKLEAIHKKQLERLKKRHEKELEKLVTITEMMIFVKSL
jgi:hypothetical protein